MAKTIKQFREILLAHYRLLIKEYDRLGKDTTALRNTLNAIDRSDSKLLLFDGIIESQAFSLNFMDQGRIVMWQSW